MSHRLIKYLPKVVDSVTVRIADRNSVAMGVSTLQLMESAGKGVAEVVASKVCRSISECKITVFCGPGGNGGDGLAAARHLASMGAEVTIYLIEANNIRSEDVLTQFDAVRMMDLSINVIEVKSVNDIPREVRADVVIDALLGIGVRGKPREPYSSAISAINRSKAYKVAIDVPSGLNPDTGEDYGIVVKADMTVTLQFIKPGLIKRRDVVGELVVIDIGIPPEALLYAGPGDVEFKLPRKEWYRHKGENGRVLVIGGSVDFPGAPRLAALAALRTGVDIVYLAAPKAVFTYPIQLPPDIIPVKLPDEDNLTLDSIPRITALLMDGKVDSIVIGPGIGLSNETREFTLKLLELTTKYNVPCVIDADALKHVATNIKMLGRNHVVTPHAGEFTKLFGIKLSDYLDERVDQVYEAAKKAGCTLLVKGVVDIVSDGVRVKLNKCHAPAMTVGGTGDTLSGIVAGLLARGVKPFEAAYIGAFINGLAGCIAYSIKGDSMTASDLINHIHEAIKTPMEWFKKALVYRRLPRYLKKP